jgi:hypothetical protein
MKRPSGGHLPIAGDRVVADTNFFGVLLKMLGTAGPTSDLRKHGREVTAMTVKALSGASVQQPIGGLWAIVVSIVDTDGYPVDDTPDVTVTLPGGTTSTPTVETVTTGVYRATYTVGTAGRYIARVTSTGYGAADFACWVEATTAGTGMPDLDAVDAYLGDHSWSDDELQDALDAEAAAQRAVCKVGAVYPADLRQALLRRVQVNLFRRGLPGGVQEVSDTQTAYVPGRDPEVRRLEGPHRKMRVG